MKPLKMNWFMSKYLGISHEWDRPRTVCELGRKILTRTLMWLFIAMVAVVVGAPPLVTGYNLIVMWYTGAAFDTIVGKEATFSGLMYVAASVELFFAILFGAGYGIRCGWVALRGKLYRYNSQRRRASGFYDRYEYIEPDTPVRDFISDLYKRFKDKTCVMLEYQDELDAEARRKREREDRQARRELAQAAAAAAAKNKKDSTS